MKLHLFLIALFTGQFLHSYESPHNPYMLLPGYQEGDETCNAYQKSEFDTVESFLISKENVIILRDHALRSSIKSNEKLSQEFARSKKMALQTALGGGFVFLVKSLTTPLINNESPFVILVGSAFFLISAWETLKSGYNIAYYVYKREKQSFIARVLTQKIENDDKIGNFYEEGAHE